MRKGGPAYNEHLGRVKTYVQKERTQSGRQAAMAKPGFRDGRPQKFTALQVEHALGLLSEYSYKQVEAMTGISRSTLQRAKKKVEVQQ